MIYTLEEIRDIVTPIAEAYELAAAYIFGSYARGEATEESDVDILIDREGSRVHGLEIGAIYNDLCEAFEKEVDMVTVQALTQDGDRNKTPWFRKNVEKERVLLYEKSGLALRSAY